MVIIMVGLPCSGKSLFVKVLKKLAGDRLFVVQPESLYPKSINSLSDAARGRIHLAAWEVAVDDFYENVGSEEHIIFDTCGSNNSFITDLMVDSERNGHKVLFVYVHASKQICKGRAAALSRNIKEHVWVDYINKFKDVVPEYGSKSDLVLVRGDMEIRDMVVKAKSVYTRWLK